MLAEGATTAYIALEVVEGIDGELAEAQRQIAEIEAQVVEFSGSPDVDAALDFYNGLVDLVQGRIRKAEDAAELNRALSMVVAGLWAQIEEDRERLLVEFELAEQPDSVLPGGVPIAFKQRPTLPPRSLEDQGLDLDPVQTETQTKVNRCSR